MAANNCVVFFNFLLYIISPGYRKQPGIIAENTNLSHNGVEIVNVMIRKYAHLTAFGILALLFLRAMLPCRRTYLPAWAFEKSSCSLIKLPVPGTFHQCLASFTGGFFC